jgi:ABC-type nitrate/sulfonate/bicarbonate transport system substrate-binding protein
MRKAAEWANTHPNDAVKVFAKYSKFTESDLLAAPRPVFAATAPPALLQPMINVAAKYQAIKAAFPAQDLVSSYAVQ